MTQRGRAAVVIVSIERYQQIEEDLERLDELELAEMVERERVTKRAGEVLSHNEVKRRLGMADAPTAKRGTTKRKARA